jgi:8-oxo-(d)GTP phosphatase
VAVASIIRAAGVVLWRRRPDDQALEFALVHRPHRRDWSLPKGKLENGEHATAAAVRETLEETGYSVTLGRPLTTLRYLVDGHRKQVRYWSAQVAASALPDTSGPVGAVGVTTGEIDGVEWLEYAKARAQLSYPHDARLLREVAKAPGDTVPLVLLRHAKAVKRATWPGTVDLARPLDGRGIGQARRLVPMLAAFGATRVVSSVATRCRDTVLPFAREHDLEVNGEWLLSEDGHEDDRRETRRLARELVAGTAPLVVCSHRPVLPDLFAEALAGWKGSAPRPLGPGAFLVVHRDLSGPEPVVVAVERHRP